MRSSTLARARRWAVVVIAFLGGGAGALALHRGGVVEPKESLSLEARAELGGVRREQALLRAESTVRLWRALEAQLEPEGRGP